MQYTNIYITDFRSALFGRFRSWLGEVLDVELEPTVDISCARYEHTGELCPHTPKERSFMMDFHG